MSRLISKSNINTFLKRNFGYFIGAHQVVLIKFDVITSTCLSHIFKYVILLSKTEINENEIIELNDSIKKQAEITRFVSQSVQSKSLK